MMLDVCICTHNPRRDILEIVLNSLVNQTLAKDKYQVWIIDNASEPEITEADLKSLRQGGVVYKIVRESRLGSVYARLKACEVTFNKFVLFVDDDNELSEDYLEIALDIAESNPLIGCFAGKLLPPKTYTIPQWMKPILPFVAFIDKGDEIISNSTNYWGPWEPPTAGALVRRSILKRYQEQIKSVPESKQIGCKGTKEILRGEDSLMMRGAYYLGLQCSYQPRLVLTHHVDPNRLNFFYLLKLLYGYGRSHVILETILGNDLPVLNWYNGMITVFKNCLYRIKIKETKSIFHIILMIAWDLGYFYQLKQKNVNE